MIEIIFLCISRRQPDPKIIFCLVIEFAVVGIAGSVPAKGFLPDCVEVDIGEFKLAVTASCYYKIKEGIHTLFDNGSEN